jgi:hypothetical protein
MSSADNATWSVVQDHAYVAYVFEAEIWGAPESVNHMYVLSKWGTLTLKATGRAFKAQIVGVLAPVVLQVGPVISRLYKDGGHTELTIALRLPNLMNGSWKKGTLKTTPKGRFVSPYKKLDGSNYIKLIEDAVADATGIDDSMNVDTRVIKDVSWRGPPSITVRYVVWLPQS